MPRPTKAIALKLSEADVERTCTDYLMLDGWRPLKTDPVSDRSRGKGFGEKGMPDYLYIRYCYNSILTAIGPSDLRLRVEEVELMWIEWKRPGGSAELHQKQWHKSERALGAAVLVAGVDFPATPEGFLEWYRKSGLNYRPI